MDDLGAGEGIRTLVPDLGKVVLLRIQKQWPLAGYRIAV
jgi:hypothetical protein